MFCPGVGANGWQGHCDEVGLPELVEMNLVPATHEVGCASD